MLTAFERTKNYANRMGIGRSLPPVVRPPLYPIWQLIRGCKSRSSESGRTATPDLFRVLLPYHLDNGNNNNNNVCRYTRKRAHARTTITALQQTRDDTTNTVNASTTNASTINDAPFDRGEHGGAREGNRRARWSARGERTATVSLKSESEHDIEAVGQ